MNRNLLLLLAVAALVVGPLLLHRKDGAEFAGSDDQATQLITRSAPGYHRWAEPIWEPPSGEIESLLFALQAAIGAGVLGYYFGRRRAISELGGRVERPPAVHAPH
ncbi:MAG: energy-coupling factor ABC transporter substrate-binding protein [Dongiaceae bacterium]